MHSREQALAILHSAERLCSAEFVSASVSRVAQEITAQLGERYPIVLSVMGGAIVFAGQLLPQLRFPLDLDYIHATRYRNSTQGQDIAWKVMPKEDVKGRVVLVIDDILDEGHTLAAVRDKLLQMGAAEFYCAVLADKEIDQVKPIQADYVGLQLPNRYVFGCGMDVKGMWRNLPEIYALKE
ncbi:MAG: hypoxanthine-guanine phosphoribosyltransferase [Burkholderiales bacterium]|nr:hypoxanthine-guanine phosphoribosyltransferase [Burkholderiales bacterium]